MSYSTGSAPLDRAIEHLLTMANTLSQTGTRVRPESSPVLPAFNPGALGSTTAPLTTPLPGLHAPPPPMPAPAGVGGASTVHPNFDLAYEIIVSALKLLADNTDRGDMKIVNAAVKEMRYAFKQFAKYRQTRKVSIFGSARTKPAAPEYKLGFEFANRMAHANWMIISGAGPGIMQAAIEGAGQDMAFGVKIRLPFEERPTKLIEQDRKLVNFKYFFTRKLMFVKEADGACVLPGGFGTMDEAFEILTLVQTGKTELVPIVLLHPKGDTYWTDFMTFVRHQLGNRGLISPTDYALFKVMDNAEEAAAEFIRFYKNYHSMRYVRDLAVMRVHVAPPDLLERANTEFADILEKTPGAKFSVGSALPEEAGEDELKELPRILFPFDRYNYGRLRQFIDLVNSV